jgi:hypothetical protein
MKANIRILRSGITVGANVYRAGDIVPPAEQTHDLQRLANGNLHCGHVWAEWVNEPVATMVETPTEDVTTHEEVAAATEPEMVSDENFDLTHAIKDLVMAGLGKRKIMEQLGKSEAYTQKQVGDEFDRLVAIGQVVNAGEPGKYAVA